jgi:hypothetical protein
MSIELCTSHAPWKSEFEDGHGWCVLSARDEIVAYIPQSIVHDEPNARLIAAAPELLRALEGLVDDWERVTNRALPDDHEAKAAIAKAKGGAL